MSWKSVWKTVAATSLAATVTMAAPAVQAADLGGGRSLKDDGDYGAPRYLWTGVYIGAQAGYGWGDTAISDASAVPALTVDADGFIGGATLGYNFQSGQIVWGIETDFSYSDIGGDRTTGYYGASETSVDWLWTVRGRLGIDINGWLPYVTAGLAVADVGYGADSNLVSKSETVAGWTVGGGLEVKLDRNWSFKTEYLFVDLGKITDRDPLLSSPPVKVTFDELHIVRAGINYKF